jgi:ferritin
MGSKVNTKEGIYMFSDNLEKALNGQINFEFYSSHLYLAMAAYFSSIDLDGFANFFTVQAEEEKFHAMKFYNYMNDMEGRVLLKGFDNPPNYFESPLAAFETALEHEKIVTNRIYNLSDMAMEEREHATLSFLKWFIDEQVEEEKNLNTIIKKLKRIENDMAAIYMLDSELAARVFVLPTNV